MKWFVRDLDVRSRLIVNAIEEPLVDLPVNDSSTKPVAYFQRLRRDERLYAIWFCDRENGLRYKTQTFPDAIPCDGTASLKSEQSAAIHLASHEVPYTWLPQISRTYLKIEKRLSERHRLRDIRNIDSDISKDSAICSQLMPIERSCSLIDKRF